MQWRMLPYASVSCAPLVRSGSIIGRDARGAECTRTSELSARAMTTSNGAAMEIAVGYFGVCDTLFLSPETGGDNFRRPAVSDCL